MSKNPSDEMKAGNDVHRWSKSKRHATTLKAVESMKKCWWEKESVAADKTVAVQSVPDGHPGNAEYLCRHGFIASGLRQGLDQFLFFLFVGRDGNWKRGCRLG